MKAIRTLGLIGYQADPAALEKLAEVPVQILDLSVASLQDNDLQHLAKLKSLVVLRMYGVKVSDAAVAKLQKSLPSLRNIERDAK
jgi:hypothetical protein